MHSVYKAMQTAAMAYFELRCSQFDGTNQRISGKVNSAHTMPVSIDAQNAGVRKLSMFRFFHSRRTGINQTWLWECFEETGIRRFWSSTRCAGTRAGLLPRGRRRILCAGSSLNATHG